jgi:Bacterial Ig domain
MRAVRFHLRVEPLEERSLLSVTLGTQFPALDFAQTGVGTPPDTIAAAGPTSIVEMVNTNIAIYNKTGGSPIFQQNLSSFFSGVMTGNFLSDPFVLFDEQAGRFVVGVMDLSASIFGTISSDRLMIAVSNNDHPTSAADFTEKHSINVTESAIANRGKVWGDYPRVGWNADEYVVTLNMFGTGFNQFYDHVSIITIGKSAAIDANNNTFTVTHTNRSGGSNFTMAPATMHDSSPGGPMYFVEEAPAANTIRVVKATNLLTSPSFTETDIQVSAYSAPPSATQLGSTTRIETNDTRILNAEWRNGRLVASQTIGVASDSQAHARWYEFSTSGTPSLTQQGTIGVGSGSNSYFPAIAIAPNGDLGMSFIQSSSSEFMSMYTTGQAFGGTPGTMQTPVLVPSGTGQAPLFASFDSSPYRAGDYSGITIDPSNGSFWAANEYATGSTSVANWGTAIANFTLSGSGGDTMAPTVTVNSPNGGETWQAGTTQTISWTASDDVGVTSVDLEYSTNGGASYTSIDTGVPNTGMYDWLVPNTPTSNARVRVTARDAVGKSGSDSSDTDFTLSGSGGDTMAPTVTVNSPNGGETWQAGTTQTISWTASDDVGVTSVDLGYSTNGGANYTAIATGVANTGSYLWLVPNTPTSNARVRVTAHDAAGNTGSDSSDSNFTISPPTVTLVTVTGINPGSIQAGTSISVTITGTGFQPGATVSFQGGRNPSPTASNISVSADGTTITATVSASNGAKTGTWDVRVTNLDSSTGVLGSGFAITGGKIGSGPALLKVPGPSDRANPPLTGESPISPAPSTIQPGKQGAGTASDAVAADVVVTLPPPDEPSLPAQDGKKGPKK